eukprot:gnl/TRDRNA2_/TRDRNA2_135966_c0_seq1.p1 gnl/TRDRNA2_/TRDRNA2_135966_c0~~gnl/TRDRNA2_/TRDRNA2_135966_c0_seq1.p1  ORF type:complete len:463 (+),score=82.89 gnl/TRDRNA2_/TRDRNA2_135966_c0_seq1:99-1487(+)
MSSHGGAEARVEVHMFWIGEKLPEWVPACVLSYLRTGHIVSWWLFIHEERQADLERLKDSELLAHPQLRLRDASGILPYAATRRFFYHGMGPTGKWSGWAPFADWFRFEVIARFGGWWVDADGVSVRNLADLGLPDSPIICTERHRMDRRTVGAVAVPRPGIESDRGGDSPQRLDGAAMCPTDFCEVPIADELRSKSRAPAKEWQTPPDKQRGAFFDWAERQRLAGFDVCLITNSHFRIPRPGSSLMRHLADDMRRMLECYASEVEKLGIDAVRQLDANGKAKCSLPTGNIGMLEFQRAARKLLTGTSSRTGGTGHPHVLHWSVFNPVEANEAPRMLRVLSGEETLCGKWIRTVHIFRQVRDEWQRMGHAVPDMVPVVSDEPPPPGSLERPARRIQPAKPPPVEVRELPRPDDKPLLKRRRSADGEALATIADMSGAPLPARRRNGAEPVRRRLLKKQMDVL